MNSKANTTCDWQIIMSLRTENLREGIPLEMSLAHIDVQLYSVPQSHFHCIDVPQTLVNPSELHARRHTCMCTH